jgi:hypothetical protein
MKNLGTTIIYLSIHIYLSELMLRIRGTQILRFHCTKIAAVVTGTRGVLKSCPGVASEAYLGPIWAYLTIMMCIGCLWWNVGCQYHYS